MKLQKGPQECGHFFMGALPVNFIFVSDGERRASPLPKALATPSLNLPKMAMSGGVKKTTASLASIEKA